MRHMAGPALTLLRQPEGATVAQIAEAMNWAPHTVRGFFAGRKKRQGITVEVLERGRQVGPNKTGAKGSYTIYPGQSGEKLPAYEAGKKMIIPAGGLAPAAQ